MNFKVRCTKCKTKDKSFIVGKIYEAKDGTFTDDDGFPHTVWNERGASFDSLREWFKDFFDFELVKESTPEIHITVKGSETIAVYKHNGEIKRAVAKCSPDDKFDFNIGAKLALERLGVLPVAPSEPVKPAGSPKPLKYKVGDRVIVEESNIEEIHSYKGYVGRIIRTDGADTHPYLIKMETEPRKGAAIYCKVRDYAHEPLKYKIGDKVIIEQSNIEYAHKFENATGDIIETDESYPYPYKVKTLLNGRDTAVWCTVKDYAPKEVPHATKMKFNWDGEAAGICGTPTKYKDENGEPLFLGDVVRTVNRTSGESFGEGSVASDGEPFIMGIQLACNPKTGEISHKWKITKTRSYKDMKPGDKVGGVKYL